jgi:hypothetical protein
MTEIGPVQLLNIGFPPGANFEGRIADELAKLATTAQSGTRPAVRGTGYRFRRAGRTRAPGGEHGVGRGALLGLTLDDAGSAADEHSFGFTQAEIEEMGQGLPPGGAAGC